MAILKNQENGNMRQSWHYFVLCFILFVSVTACTHKGVKLPDRHFVSIAQSSVEIVHSQKIGDYQISIYTPKTPRT